MIAPLGENERGDLVNERDFQFAEVAGGLGGFSRTAEQTIHKRQADGGRHCQQTHAFQRIGAEQRDVRRTRQGLGEFLVADDLHLAKLQREFEPEKNGEPRGHAPDELLVALLDAAKFAGGEKAGLAEIVFADVVRLVLGAGAGGRQHGHFRNRRSGGLDGNSGRRIHRGQC